MVLVVMVMLNFQSCTNGPLEFLATKKKRLVNKWDLDRANGELPIVEFYANNGWGWGPNGVEVEVNDFDIEYEFQDDGDFDMDATYELTITNRSYYGYGYVWTTETRVNMNLDGEWEFSPDKEEIWIEFDNNGYSQSSDLYDEREYKIDILTSDNMVLEAENGEEWRFSN